MFSASEPRQDRPLVKAVSITSASLLMLGSSPFQADRSRLAEMYGESAHAAGRERQCDKENCAPHVLPPFTRLASRPQTSDPPEKLTPAEPSELTAALAFTLRYQGGKRVRNADEIMVEIVAKRLVEHLKHAGFVAMKRPPEVGAAALGWAGVENA